MSNLEIILAAAIIMLLVMDMVAWGMSVLGKDKQIAELGNTIAELNSLVLQAGIASQTAATRLNEAYSDIRYLQLELARVKNGGRL